MDAWTLAEDHRARSDHVRGLLLGLRNADPFAANPETSTACTSVPRILVRFWHDPAGPPPDVAACLDSWLAVAEVAGCDLVTFHDMSAHSFIARHFGAAAAGAYAACPHPAMRSDLFRLCWLVERGGAYIDADDALVTDVREDLFAVRGLALQPLCYDRETDSMVPASVFQASPAAPSWTFYANNAPIVAVPDHPVLAAALERALSLVTATASGGGVWDIQNATGPGNLTIALVARSLASAKNGESIDLRWLDWDSVAVSRYPLEYRSDRRNWRLWNGADPVDAFGHNAS